MSDTANLIISLCRHHETGLLTSEELAVAIILLIKEMVGGSQIALPKQKEKGWTSSIDEGGVTYSLAPADFEALTGPHNDRPTKVTSGARYILRSSGESAPSPIYFMRRDRNNHYVTATHLKSVDGIPMYKNLRGESYPIDWDNQDQKV